EEVRSRPTSELCDAGPNSGRGPACQVASLHATKRILSCGAFSRRLRYRSHERVVGSGICGGQLQFDETVRRDRIDRVATGQVCDLVAVGGQCLLNQDDGTGGGMQGTDAPVAAVTVATGSLELDAQSS